MAAVFLEWAHVPPPATRPFRAALNTERGTGLILSEIIFSYDRQLTTEAV
jgi:hypothetical protein